MQKTVSKTLENFGTVRTGRASPQMLDRVEVEYYGVPTPIKQLASVGVMGASSLVVDPYDKTCLPDIEKAIFQSDIGITPSNDGAVIRLEVPPMTKETRKQMVKTVKEIAEQGKVAIRNIRRDAIDGIKKLEKAKELGEDESRDKQDVITKLANKYTGEIDTQAGTKEKEMMKV